MSQLQTNNGTATSNICMECTRVLNNSLLCVSGNLKSAGQCYVSCLKNEKML